MNEIKEKFLPLGTVCMLKEGTHAVMIIGYVPVPTNNQQGDGVYGNACNKYCDSCCNGTVKWADLLWPVRRRERVLKWRKFAFRL